ncbi:MAG: hypothetical protein U0457_08530 [Candidatus Sericytochromatia bacterium]
MEKNSDIELITEIQSLKQFAEFLDNENKDLFLYKIDNLLYKIKNYSTNTNINLDFSDLKNQEEQEMSLFDPIISSIIPTLKENISNINLSEIEKITISNINGLSSIKDIYEFNKDIYPNFIFFSNILMELESKNIIDFSKNNKEALQRGWIKLGEILSQGNILVPLNIEEAADFKNRNGKMFIGEAFVELNLISDKLLRNALKTQKWISKTVDKLNKDN